MKTSEFIKMLNDPELGQKMSAAKSPQETYEFAKINGVTDSYEDFVVEMEKLKNSIGELSEDDLASVAGGSDLEDATIIVSAVTSTVGAAVSAATAAA